MKNVSLTLWDLVPGLFSLFVFSYCFFVFFPDSNMSSQLFSTNDITVHINPLINPAIEQMDLLAGDKHKTFKQQIN